MPACQEIWTILVFIFLYINYWLLRLKVQNDKYYVRVFFQPLAANQYFHEVFVFFTAIIQVNIGAERNELNQDHEVWDT